MLSLDLTSKFPFSTPNLGFVCLSLTFTTQKETFVVLGLLVHFFRTNILPFR